MGNDGAEIALSLRAGAEKDPAYTALIWEKDRYRFANYKQAKGGAALFLGCNFPSAYPKTTDALVKLMAAHGIGAVYDCCRKPISDLGLADRAGRGVADIDSRLRAAGVTELIAVCPNCMDFLEGRIGLPIVDVYAKLRELGEGRRISLEKIPVFFPCPDRARKRIFASLSQFIDGTVTEKAPRLQCCGLGGCAATKEPKLAKAMAAAVGPAQGMDGEVYVYCASCADSFSRGGASVHHFLPLILELDEKPSTGLRGVVNRARRAL